MEKPDLSIQMKSTDTVHVQFLRVNRVRSLVHYSIENCHFVFKHGVNDVMLYRECNVRPRGGWHILNMHMIKWGPS